MLKAMDSWSDLLLNALLTDLAIDFALPKNYQKEAKNEWKFYLSEWGMYLSLK